MRNWKRVAEEVRERAQMGTFALIESSKPLFAVHSVNRIPAIHWNPATRSSCGDAPNEGPWEANEQLLLLIGSVVFLRERRARLPRSLREARAADPVESMRGNFRIRPTFKRPARAHP